MKTRVIGAALAALMLLVLVPVSSFSTERTKLLGTSGHSEYALSNLKNTGATARGELSPLGVQFASKLGVLSKIQKLQTIRAQANTDASSKLEQLALKEELVESIFICAEELRTVIARVNSEIADTSEVHAHLSEGRDRAVRINTYANLVSGGITGMVGGGLKLGDVNHLAPDLIDTTEGVIQTALATWALAQQRGEERYIRKSPGLLSHLMNRTSEVEGDFPPSVWAYLNLPSRNANDTIVKSLVDRWFTLNLCLKHSGHRESRASRQLRLSSDEKKNNKVTIDVLEDRMAMLSDLRACIEQMDFLILELMHCVRGTRTVPTN